MRLIRKKLKHGENQFFQSKKEKEKKKKEIKKGK